MYQGTDFENLCGGGGFGNAREVEEELIFWN
jgi:hypothetical protein